MRSFIILALFCALPAFAQRGGDHSGVYKGEVATSSGKVENTLVIKQDAKGKVTGTLTNQYGTLPLIDGAMDQDDVFFVVVVNDEGHDFRMVYRGRIFDNEFQFKVEAGERRIDWIAGKVGTQH
jgi:hypothetical protein